MKTLIISAVLLLTLAGSLTAQPVRPVKPTQMWSGVVPDEALRAAAPKSGYITNEARWTHVWESWRPGEPRPVVDFKTSLVLVQTAAGPNRPAFTPTLSAAGDLRFGPVRATLIGGPGFGYAIQVIMRAGIRTIEGQPVLEDPEVAYEAVVADGTKPFTELKPRAVWSQVLFGPKPQTLRKYAPAKGYITGQAAWTKLWRTWQGRGAAPKVDFAREIVIVQMAAGPNEIFATFRLENDGNLVITGGQTLRQGAGFGYSFFVISREGLQAIAGRPIISD